MAFLLIVFSFGYLLSVLYGVLAPYRDSGDLVASAFSLGIAHPPGYSLYGLITKVGMIIFPLGNFAYRANFLSVLWSSLTVSVLYGLLKRFVSPTAALLAAVIWFLSPSVLQLSLVSEMYTLNALFCSLILASAFLVLEGDRKKRNRLFFLSFFLIGIGFFNHPTLVFLIPGLLTYWWFANSSEKSGRMRSLLLFLLFGSMGFSLILYYPIRSFRNPLVDWGDPENFRLLWRLITRSDYGGLKLHPEDSHFSWNITGFLDQLVLFVRAEWMELKFWGLALALLGLVQGLKKVHRMRAPLLHVCAVTFVIAGPVFFLLSNLSPKDQTTLPILEPYLVMLNCLAVPWIAVGAEKFLSISFKNLVVRRIMSGVFLVILLLISFPKSRRKDFYAYDYGRNIFKTIPPHSSFYNPDDTTAFVMSYLQTVEGRRKDIVPLMTLRTFWGYRQIKRRYPFVMPPEDFKDAHSFIQALLGYHYRTGRPLFSDHPSKFPGGFGYYPSGILTRSGIDLSMQAFKDRQNVFHFYTERGRGRELRVDQHHEFFTRHLLSRMSSAFNNIGIVMQGQSQFAEAESYFKKALLREPGLSQAWNNLGITFYLQKKHEDAEKVYLQGLKYAGEAGPLYVHLALSQRSLGKGLEAEKSLERALTINPRNERALNEMGLVYLDRKKWDEARLWFEKCLKINPDHAPAYYNLGLVFLELGAKRQAMKSFQKYINLSPNAPDKPQVQLWIYNLLQTLSGANP